MSKTHEQVIRDFLYTVQVQLIEQKRLPLIVIAADVSGVVSVIGVETLSPEVAKEVLQQVLSNFDNAERKYFANTGNSNKEIKR